MHMLESGNVCNDTYSVPREPGEGGRRWGSEVSPGGRLCGFFSEVDGGEKAFIYI